MIVYIGIHTSFFRKEQAGPLKQNDWGPGPKLRGLGFGEKLNNFNSIAKH